MKRQQPRRHRADTCAVAPSCRHASAAPLAGLVSFATAPLHFTSISQATFPFHSFRRSQTVETGTDSVAPGDSGNQRPRCFAYRPGQQYGARLCLSPKTAAIARDASHGQGISIIREIGHFRPASISLATLQRTETTELTGKTNWSDTLPLGFAACWSRLTEKRSHQPAIMPLRSSARESNSWLRAGATAPSNETRRID